MNNRVTESAMNIRGVARSALKGNWKDVCIGMILYMVISSLVVELLMVIFPNYITNEFISEPVNVPYIPYLYLALVSGPLNLGITTFFMHFFRKKEINPGYVFNGFGHFFKSFGLQLVMGILCAWPMIIAYGVMIIMIVVTLGGSASGVLIGGLGFLSFILVILACVYMIIQMFAYSQAFYLQSTDLMDDTFENKRGIMGCLRESKQLMKGNKGKLFCVEISYIGWYILAAIPMGVVSAIMVESDTNAIVVAIIGFIAELPLAAVYSYYYTGMMVFHDILVGKLVPKPSQILEDVL